MGNEGDGWRKRKFRRICHVYFPFCIPSEEEVGGGSERRGGEEEEMTIIEATINQNKWTIVHTWDIKYNKYGNETNVTTLLMDAFMKTVLKSKSDESKLVELREVVSRLNSDLILSSFSTI